MVQKQHQNLETPYQVLKLTGIPMIRNPIGTMHINKLGEETTFQSTTSREETQLHKNSVYIHKT